MGFFKHRDAYIKLREWERGFQLALPRRDGSVVSVYDSHEIGREPGWVIAKTIIKMVQTASLHGT